MDNEPPAPEAEGEASSAPGNGGAAPEVSPPDPQGRTQANAAEPIDRPAGELATAGDDADATVVAGPMSSDEISPGTVISNTFRIRKLIGRGGMGQVYLAEHTFQRTLHALKRISPQLSRDEKYMALFRREAELLRKVNSEAIVGYDGVIVHDEAGRVSVFLAMEFAEGPSLKSLVLEKGPLSPDECLKLLRRVATGLGAAHARGVFHRDMSPDNIIIPDGDCDRAKIIDFGIARDDQGGSDEPTLLGGGFAGKLGYASPEQFGLHKGMIDARTDIYALGLSIFYAATGRALFRTRDVFEARETRLTPPSLHECPEELRDVIAPMLAPLPADRPASMKDVVASSDVPLAVADAAAPSTAASPGVGPIAEKRSGNTVERQPGKKPRTSKERERARNRPETGKSKGNALLLAGSAAAGVILLAVGVIAFGDSLFIRPSPGESEPDNSAAGGSAPGDRQILSLVRANNDLYPGCLWLPLKDDQPTDGVISVLAVGVAGDCAGGDQKLRDDARSKKLSLTIEDESRLALPGFRDVIRPWFETFRGNPADAAIRIDFPNSAGRSLRTGGGVYVGTTQSPGEFAITIDYDGKRARLFPDIVRFDGWLYRAWQDDTASLRQAGWLADSAPITMPNPSFIKPNDRQQDSNPLPTRKEFLTGVNEAPRNVTIGAVVVLASDIAALPCAAVNASAQELGNSELSEKRSANWTERIATECIKGESEMRIALYAWIPPERAAEFLLE